MSAPIEVTTRYVTSDLSDLTAAWAFVMEHVDKVGPYPTIHIEPVWTMPVGDMSGLEGEEVRPTTRTFTAVVEGMVEK